MASAKQRAAARRNIKKAQAALRRKKRGGARKATKRRRRRAVAKKSNPPRRRRKTVAARKRAPARRRRRSSSRRRRNPGGGTIVRQFTQGAQDALGVVAGKALARMIPTVVPQLPKAGVVGLGVQAATAVLVGFGASKFLGREVGRMVLAGGLSAPLETAVVAFRVPFLGTALDPVASTAAVAAASMGAYVPRRVGSGRPLAAYVNPNGGLGSMLPHVQLDSFR